MLKQFSLIFAAWLAIASGTLSGQTAPSLSGTVIFGDSLSDDGNFADVTAATYGVRFPSFLPLFGANYTDGRFTDGLDTRPAARAYFGVWHEQLSTKFLKLPVATPSLKGGTDFAFGSATTEDGTQVITQGRLSVTVENMGQQVTDYLSRSTPPDSHALHVVWGGSNDLFRDSSAANVSAAALRVTNMVERLARAGAVYFLVPNLPPLGYVPSKAGQGSLTPASLQYRDQINADLSALQLKLAAANVPIQIYRLDMYSLYMKIVTNPAAYNLVDVMHPAQDNLAINPDTYLFWDGLHPTTAGHFDIASAAYNVLIAPPSIASGPPVISGVVNGASFQPSFSSGSWVTIFGSNLSPTTRSWNSSDFTNGNLPTMLDNVSVTINGKPAFVYYVSPTQLNVLAPADGTTGTVNVTVSAPGGAVTAQATKNSNSPAFFTFNQQGGKYIAAVFPDGTYSGPAGLFGAARIARPAKTNDIIQLYATGLGMTNPTYPDGQILNTSYPLTVLPQVTIGGQMAVVQYAGLVGAGLYQLNVVIPPLADGDQSVVIDLGTGIISPLNVSFLSILN